MNNRFDWRDFLTFDKMIAPAFLTILYYIDLALLVLFCLFLIVKGLDTPYGGGVMVFGGIVGLLFGPLLIRLSFEFVIVVFKIHSRLISIDGKTTRGTLAHEPIIAASKVPEVVPFHPEPPTTPTPSVVIEPKPEPKQDFWSLDMSEPVSSASAQAAPVPPVDMTGLLQKVPNLPVVIASLFVLIGVMGSYANVLGVGYSIKNSTLGIFALFASLGMIFISAAGLKWIWFISSYVVVLLGTVVAFFDDNSLFSQVSRSKTAINSLGDVAGQYFPGANRLMTQATQNIPGPSQFLTVTFYLFVIAMMYCGYWALSGKYREKGFMTP